MIDLQFRYSDRCCHIDECLTIFRYQIFIKLQRENAHSLLLLNQDGAHYDLKLNLKNVLVR